MTFPAIDPVAFCIGPVAIRWYALAYLGGLLAGWMILKRITARPGDPVGPAPVDALMNAGIIGIILGGRLGFVLFYNPGHYIANPMEIFAVWQGGLSFHGGMLGLIGAIVFVARRHNIHWLDLTDLVSLVAPIGLFFGRMANFINAELYGRATDLPWGMVFPRWQGGVCDGGWVPVAGAVPRHPSQLYEAGLEGVLLFIILFMVWRGGGRDYHGRLAGVFLAGYGIARFLVEFVREPDATLVFDILTRGQALSLPMIILGIVMIVLAPPRRQAPRNHAAD